MIARKRYFFSFHYIDCCSRRNLINLSRNAESDFHSVIKIRNLTIQNHNLLFCNFFFVFVVVNQICHLNWLYYKVLTIFLENNVSYFRCHSIPVFVPQGKGRRE